MNAGDREQVFEARKIHGGQAQGDALVTTDGLSFWGGVDPATGVITDVRHALHGRSITGKVFVFPRGAGSSSGCGVLMEMVRRRTHPAALVNVETEAILALGPILADELYRRSFPIVQVDAEIFARLATGDHLRIDAERGTITRARAAEPAAPRSAP